MQHIRLCPGNPHPLTHSLSTLLQDGKEPVTCSVPASAPAQQKGGPSSSKAAKGGASGSASIDTAWVAEHGSQVMRMLPGGGSVCPSAFVAGNLGADPRIGRHCMAPRSRACCREVGLCAPCLHVTGQGHGLVRDMGMGWVSVNVNVTPILPSWAGSSQDGGFCSGSPSCC